MATILDRLPVQRLIVDGDPTAAGAIQGTLNPGDRIYRSDTGVEYAMTAAGVVAEASLDESPVFTSLSVGGPITITGTTANPASTVRYIGTDSSASVLAFNVPSGGYHNFRVAGVQNVVFEADTYTFGGSAGGAWTLVGRIATGTDTASGAVTISANRGTGTGAVGGFLFKVPVTTGTGTTTQTLTTVLTLDATTVVRAEFSGALTVGSAAAAAFQVGPNSGTNPTFKVVCNVASQATGLSVTGAAAASGLAVAVLSSGNDEALTVNAKGTGTIGIGTVSTGNITLGSLVVTNAVSVTLTGGAGNMTIVAGTGNSRTLTLQSTTSGGTATNAIAIDAVQDVTISTGHLVMQSGKTVKCGVSTTAAASLNLGNAGTAPTSPNNGDMWIESNTVKVRLNGATVTVTTS